MRRWQANLSGNGAAPALALALVLFLGGHAPAGGQGAITLNNQILGTVVAPVYGPEPGQLSLAKTGNTSSGYPQGTQSYRGAFLAGPGYSAQLFVGPNGAAEEQLAATYPVTTFRTGTGQGFVWPVEVGSALFSPGQIVTLQLRAWDNRGGTVGTWAQVLADPTVPRGLSPRWAWMVPSLVPGSPMAGLRSFNLFVPLQLFCPPDLVVAADPGGWVKSNLTYAVSTSDPSDPNLVLVCSPPSGATFLAGTTAVQCAVTNATGQTSQCGFTVTVWDSTQPITVAAAPGSSLCFCGSEAGSTNATYRWRKNRFNLPDGTNACLTLSELTVADGGRYDLVTREPTHDSLSGPIELVLTAVEARNGSDSFHATNSLWEGSGVVRGTNTLATHEPFEPNHAGQPGSHSVWYVWWAPSNGVLMLHTRGSTFDTLLAVYRGTTLSNLVTVAADDDQGGFFASETRFNAQAGIQYLIAVDGFGAEKGVYMLSWDFIPTGLKVPMILTEPVAQTVPRGGTASFSVRSDTNAWSYQWLHNDLPIPGATGTNLTLTNVQATSLGSYSVVVSNAFGGWNQSDRVQLQIGNATHTIKPRTLFACANAQRPILGPTRSGIDPFLSIPQETTNISQGLGFGQGLAGTMGISFNVPGGADLGCSARVADSIQSCYLTATNRGVLIFWARVTNATPVVDLFSIQDCSFTRICDYQSLTRSNLIQIALEAERGQEFLVEVGAVGQTAGSVDWEDVDWNYFTTLKLSCSLVTNNQRLEFKVKCEPDPDMTPCLLVLEAASDPRLTNWLPVATNTLPDTNFFLEKVRTNLWSQRPPPLTWSYLELSTNRAYRTRFQNSGDSR